MARDEHGRPIPASPAGGGRRSDTRREVSDGHGMLPEALSLPEIEQRMRRIDDELEALVDEHGNAADTTANSKADWERHLSLVLVQVADSGEKTAEDLRKARALQARVDRTDATNKTTGNDLYRTYLVHEAREKNLDRALKALQARAMGLMAVMKNIRGEAN